MMIYDKDKFYNPELKSHYLEQIENEGSQKTIANLFRKIKNVEESKNKDVAEFDYEELKEVFYALKPMTLFSSRSNGSLISGYISFALSKINSTNIHPLSGKSQKWFEQFVDKSKKLYFSEDEIEYFEDNLVNAQEQAIIRLLFEGVSGYNLTELSNLHYYDIDWENNVLKLKDDRFGKRQITVSDRCIRIVKNAYYETEYKTKNGEGGLRRDVLDIIPSDYIFKMVRTGNVKTYHGIDRHTFYRRFKMMRDYFELAHFSPENIVKSGMIKMAKDFYLQDDEFNTKHLYKIAEHFGLRKSSDYYNISNLKIFINMENINKLYNLE